MSAIDRLKELLAAAQTAHDTACLFIQDVGPCYCGNLKASNKLVELRYAIAEELVASQEALKSAQESLKQIAEHFGIDANQKGSVWQVWTHQAHTISQVTDALRLEKLEAVMEEK